MSGLKNSPFGKRLRATHQDNEEDGPRRNRQRVNPIFYTATPPTTKDATPESPAATRDMYGDRFVPSRDTGDMRTTYHLMDESGPSTPSKNRIIPTESDALKGQSSFELNSLASHSFYRTSQRNIHFYPPHRTHPHANASSTTPHPPHPQTPSTPTRRLDTPTDEAYSMSPVRAESRQLLESPRRQLRSVCKTPYPHDFYLNLVDWSSTNVLGVGLGSCVYLWTAHNAAVSKLCDLAGSNDTVSSVSWVQKGTMLAIGTLSGRMHIYDANTLQVQRSYNNAHSQRIGALAWNTHVLSSGSRDRMVHHRDVRDPSLRPFKRCAGHRQEVCGLKWARDGGPLASGGNDNKVCIWDLRGSKRCFCIWVRIRRCWGRRRRRSGGGDSPLWKFHEHTAAVKALAWDPHVSGVLATGGGTQDKHIRFWNTFNGTMLSELDTGSQVCNLIWSLTSHELICIWKYPNLNMVASLTGHTHRVLYLAMSPDGETIVTGAGDETLRFWNAFPKKEGGERRETRLDYGRLIR
ncbi:WD40 repeat-like protein [Suillus paluster]|uniref:WD40 repeat-like protein n=1 Tax=Suillus paluster TaxID=48578 RepID=UPI001B870090|nr:WD40 repeat-like protein [Suillus paluster]KAG1726950.1 WD40 repeat-like protein [Suillus paluster]